MKKYLYIIIAMLLASCVESDDYTYTITYKIYYTDSNVSTKTLTGGYPYRVYYGRGVTEILCQDSRIEDKSTAPIEIISQSRTNNRTKVVEYIETRKE